MLTAYDLVWMSADRTPDHLALVDDRSTRSLTYRQLIEEIDRVAAGLAARGVQAGMRVATVLPGLFDHAVALLALQRLAAVPALLNFRLKPQDLATLVRHGEIAGAIILADAALATTLKGALPESAVLLSVGGAAGPAEDYAACRADAPPPSPRPGREDPAFIFYTSGTTGLPKGVVLAHRTSEHRVLWLSTQAGLRHGTHNRALGFMPMSHAIGFYGVFLVTLAMNGTYYVMSAFDPQKAVEMIERHAITYLFAIPTLYHAIVSAPNYRPAAVASLELVLFGGAAIEPLLIQRMAREWRATIRHIYGTTETMCSLYNPEPVLAPSTVRPGFYSRVRVVRPGGAADALVAPGVEGELIVDATADTIFSGYLNRPDATADRVRDGWYYTGDVCLQRPDGDVDLKGRIDDVIRSGGENVHPDEIEAVIARHPGVAEVSVIGLPDPRWGQIVVACVVAKDRLTNAEALDRHCRDSTLAAYKRPRDYVFLDKLPRNAANKVLRRELRDAALAARAGEGAVPFAAIATS